MSGLTRHGRLKFDIAAPFGNCSDVSGSATLDGYGVQISSTLVDIDTNALDVFLGGFDSTLTNEDGYLYVDFSNDLLDADGYLVVTVSNNVPNASEHAEDSPHISGDFGTLSLAVMHTADTSLVDTDGDYAPFQLNDIGRLKVDMDWASTIPLTTDGYLRVDIGAATISTSFETIIEACPLTGSFTGAQSFIADEHRRLWVNNASAIAGKTQTATVDSTASLLLPAELAGRTRILLQNLGDAELYLGFDLNVTADNLSTGGFLLSCNDAISLEISDCVKLYAITKSGETGTVKILETA